MEAGFSQIWLHMSLSQFEDLQWNLCNMNTLGPTMSVLIFQISLCVLPLDLN